MFVVNIILLFLVVTGYLISIKREKEWFQTIDKKEHPLYFFYPLADLLLLKTGLNKILCRRDKVKDAIRSLNVIRKPEHLQRLYWCNRVSTIILILSISSVLSLLGQFSSSSNSILINGNYLARPSYGEGEDEVELNVVLRQKNRKKEKNKINTENNQKYLKDIKIQVEEQRYTKTELNEAFHKAVKYLDTSILGENKSPNKIYQNLSFCTSIPGTSITVDWQPQDYNLVQSDGTVNNGDIKKNGRITTITALLAYHNKQMEYKKTLRIMPKKITKEELIKKQLRKKINILSKQTMTQDKLKLPHALRNYQLRWKDIDSKADVKLFIFGVITAILIWFLSDKELEDKLKKRKSQMLLDYPDIINKFTLLVNAGMTVKQAWSKISSDYEDKLRTGQIKRRYAYDEMLVTVHELKLGINEGEAYEQFGRRSGLLLYMKFSTLIAQNLKKGNAGLCELLKGESMEAFEERKEAAKRMGEEAGTKLLIPMMIMLIIVFIIILVPAFQSFRM